MTGKRLKATHIDDNNRDGDTHLPPYFGTIRWSDVMQALRDIDYRGDFSFELGSQKMPDAMRDTWCKFIFELGMDLIEKA